MKPPIHSNPAGIIPSIPQIIITTLAKLNPNNVPARIIRKILFDQLVSSNIFARMMAKNIKQVKEKKPIGIANHHVIK